MIPPFIIPKPCHSQKNRYNTLSGRQKKLAFFESELGRLATDPKNTVHREWPFIIALTAAELTEDANEETVIVQGIVDMIIETPDGLVLVDFKTDRVKTGQIHERANLYAKQLNLYAKAAARILNRKVDRSYLYFTNPAAAVKIKD